MQQVFGLMNALLARDKRTAAKKRLSVRTYKIVPLSQRSGLLEWCENTSPIKDYLIGADQKTGAHSRYHPQDWPAQKCKEELSAAQKKYGSSNRPELCKVRDTYLLH